MKTDLIEKLKYIETSYDVENIEYAGIKIWPFIRSEVIYSYYYSDLKIQPVTVKQSSKLQRLLQAVRCTSLHTFFKKRASLIFTDDVGMKKYEGKYIDRIMQSIFDYEVNNIPVVIKLASPEVSSLASYVDSLFVGLIIRFFMMLRPYKKEIFKNESSLKDILAYLHIDYDYIKKIRIIQSCYCFYCWYFNKTKPKNIYVNCYYDIIRMPAFLVAKEMGIPVIEIQHGIIYSHHFAYIGFKKIDPNPYPNYIFIYGTKFKNYISPVIYKPENVFVTGSFYMNLMLNTSETNRLLFADKYKKCSDKIIITVAGQHDLDFEILSFIEQVAVLDRDMIFIYIPRFLADYHRNYNHKQIYIEYDLDIYKCMQNSHVTTAVISTCALESLVFGVPSALINIDNLAKSLYGPSLTDINSIFYANTPEEYIESVYKAIQLDRDSVQQEGNLFFADNYDQRLKDAISEIGIKYAMRDQYDK